MAEESLRDIINESKKPPSKLRVVVLVMISFLIIIGGAYYAINTLSNSVVTPNLPSLPGIPGLQKQASPPASPSPTTEKPSGTSEESLSDKDDTSTLQKELDSTVLQDSSSSDSETLDKDIKEL